MLHEFRFIAGVPFGFLAELFARLAIYISGNQLNVDFNYIGRRWQRTEHDLCDCKGIVGDVGLCDGACKRAPNGSGKPTTEAAKPL
jgi:hypothetical protein